MIIFEGVERYEALNALLRANKTIQKGAGAEIGVRWGDTAEFILRNNPSLKTYILVDPYRPYNDCGNECTQEEQDKNKETAFIRLEPFMDVAVWVRLPSKEAAKQVTDGELDFVFIDAEHTYESVRVDVEAWFPKIRKGGLLTGHDYFMPEVKRLVDDFAKATHREVVHTGKLSEVWAMEV